MCYSLINGVREMSVESAGSGGHINLHHIREKVASGHIDAKVLQEASQNFFKAALNKFDNVQEHNSGATLTPKDNSSPTVGSSKGILA